MEIRDFVEAEFVENEDLLLLQKTNNEYQKIKSKTLLSASSGNPEFTDYYRGDIEPTNKPIGFIWDEANSKGLVQRWIKSAQGWQSSFYDINHGIHSPTDTSYVFKIDKRFDFSIHYIFMALADYSEKGYIGKYGLKASIFTDKFPIFNSKNSNNVGALTTEGASSYQFLQFEDYIHNGVIRKQDDINYLMMQTKHIDPPRHGLTFFKISYSYLR